MENKIIKIYEAILIRNKKLKSEISGDGTLIWIFNENENDEKKAEIDILVPLG